MSFTGEPRIEIFSKSASLEKNFLYLKMLQIKRSFTGKFLGDFWASDSCFFLEQTNEWKALYSGANYKLPTLQ